MNCGAEVDKIQYRETLPILLKITWLGRSSSVVVSIGIGSKALHKGSMPRGIRMVNERTNNWSSLGRRILVL